MVSRRRNKRKKLEPGTEPTPIPTPGTGKILWDSSKVWNSNPRTVTDKDPHDPLIAKIHGPGFMVIDGRGNATFSTDGAEGSIRFYLKIPNTNTECMGKIKTSESLSNWNTNHRNNHIPACGFGGYHLNWHIEEQLAFAKKELLHAEYGSDSGKKPCKLEANKEYGFKSRVENTADGKVRCRSWIAYDGSLSNWTALTDYTDAGTWPGLAFTDKDTAECFKAKKGIMADRNKDTFNKPVLTQQPYFWIRMNAIKEKGDFVKDVVLSNVTIREL